MILQMNIIIMKKIKKISNNDLENNWWFSEDNKIHIPDNKIDENAPFRVDNWQNYKAKRNYYSTKNYIIEKLYNISEYLIKI